MTQELWAIELPDGSLMYVHESRDVALTVLPPRAKLVRFIRDTEEARADG